MIIADSKFTALADWSDTDAQARATQDEPG